MTDAELPEDLRKEIMEVCAKTPISLEWLVNIYRRGYNDKLGPTGNRPYGKLSDDDEGELRVAIGIDHRNGVIRLEFGKQVSWIALPSVHVYQLARILVEKATELDKRIS